jgi:acyl carrier protein
MQILEEIAERPATAAEFESHLLHFINEVLPALDRHERTWPAVSASTPLFAAGLLDSLSILHLITAIEELTGRAVPDHLVVMKHFQSVSAIASTFWPANH